MINVICAIAKKENDYIREWVEYHFKIGFDKIYLWDNNDPKGERFEYVINDYIQNEKVIIIDCRGKKYFQRPAYTQFYKIYSTTFDWCAFIDIDEFIFLNRHINITDYLSEQIFNNFYAIRLNWVVFGDNEKIYKESGKVIDRFTKPSTKVKILEGKSIIRGNLFNLIFNSAHYAHFDNIKTPIKQCDNVGNLLSDNNTYKFETLNIENCFIKHYQTKSLEEFCLNKLFRDSANIKRNRVKIDYYFNINEKTDEKNKFIDDFLLKNIKDKPSLRVRLLSLRRVLYEMIDINLKSSLFLHHGMSFSRNVLRRFSAKSRCKKLGFCCISIETYGICNRKCEFCFNDDKFPKRETGVMKKELWKKIMDELAEIKFSGRISPHFYGEPLLDRRLPELMEYARKKCPKSYIQIYSNGDFLNEVILKNLVKRGVDHFLITNYDDKEKPEIGMLKKKYSIHMTFQSYKDFEKVDRAGKIFGRKKILNNPCLRPSSQVVINWKGDVILCCQDFYAIHSFGNIGEKSLMEIWNSKEFRDCRDKLSSGKRREVDLCKNCDYSGRFVW